MTQLLHVGTGIDAKSLPYPLSAVYNLTYCVYMYVATEVVMCEGFGDRIDSSLPEGIYIQMYVRSVHQQGYAVQ